MIPSFGRKSRLSAFLLGVLLAFGLRSVAAFAADAPATIPCPAESAPAESVPAEIAPPVVPDPPSAPVVRFSEFFPNPAGTDTEGEFIEIENPSETDAEVTGWRITDAKGKIFVFPAMRIAARSSRMFMYAETKIPLVNDAAGYVLQDANGTAVDSASYPAPVPEGKSYARFEGGWRWTETPTPGAANVYSETPIVPPPPAPAPEPAPALPAPPPAAETPVVINEPAAVADLAIEEFLPNPDGDDATEWIELRNRGTVDGSLAGWTLDDAEGGSAPYRFADETVVAGGRFVAHRSMTRIALNNDVDEVRLIAPDGSVRQRIRYENAPSGRSFANDGTVWRWTSPTPGDPNVFDDIAPAAAATIAAPDAIAAAAVTSEEEAVTDAVLEDIFSMDDDTTVSLSAIVTLPPGVVGKTILAVRDSDGTHGTYVRLRGRAAVPDLHLGDIVSLRGRVRREGDATLSVNAKDIVRTGHDPRTLTLERDPAGVTEDEVGLAVSVMGKVTAKGKGWVRLGMEGDGAEIRGTFPKGVAVGSITVGDDAAMTGVVRMRSGKPEIVMLEKSSFTAKKTASVQEDPKPIMGTENEHEERKTIVLSSSSEPLPVVWSIAAFVAVSGTITGYALWRRRRFA